MRTEAGKGVGRAFAPTNSRAPSFLLRGGRLTKWKGQAASYAPHVAQLLTGVSRATLLPAALLAGMAAGPAAAQVTRYWDANANAAGSGGTGTWNASNLNWSPNGDGASGPYNLPWNNAGGDSAVFGGVAGTVTLGVPITVHNIIFDTGGYTLKGEALTLSGASPTITVNSGTSTISSIIAGSAGLTKDGAGTLSLTGANTFTGGLIVDAGGLSVGSDAALGDVSNSVTLNNGVSFAATGALSASRQVVLDGAVSISGAGVGSALYTGAGELSIFRGVTMNNDANNYTGTTITNAPGTAGTVSFTSVRDTGVASSLGAGGEIYLRGVNNYIGDGDTTNRTFRFQPSANATVYLINQGTGALALTGAISLDGGPRGVVFSADRADLDLSGAISGANPATVTFTGGGVARTITLGGGNTYTTGNSISTVTLRISTLADRGAASSLGTNANTGVGLADIQISNSVLDYGGMATAATAPGSFRIVRAFSTMARVG